MSVWLKCDRTIEQIALEYWAGKAQPPSFKREEWPTSATGTMPFGTELVSSC